jgi:hypothetical protein
VKEKNNLVDDKNVDILYELFLIGLDKSNKCCLYLCGDLWKVQDLTHGFP